MKTANSELMKQARAALSGKWGLAIGAMWVSNILLIAVRYIPKVGGIASLLLTGPFSLGLIIFSLSLSRNQNPEFELIFEGFKRFGAALLAYILVAVFSLLWSLLLVIPGIIAALSYSMTFYILADNPSVSGKEAINRSKKMMYGYKWKLFGLNMRFLGWGLLCILTLGIGFIWLIPYASVASAKFYDDIKNSSPVSSSQTSVFA